MYMTSPCLALLYFILSDKSNNLEIILKVAFFVI